MEPFNHYPDEPLYNIRAVAQKTQIDSATLRAWERRYSIPHPKRDVQGHRLYSERDVMILRWLKQQVDASIRIKQAVEMLHVQMPQSLAATPVHMPTTNAFPDVVDAFVDAVVLFDYLTAQQILTNALSIYRVEDVCVNMIFSALVQIEQGWVNGTITLQAEHFATNIIRERLNAMLAAAPAPTRPGRLVIGCAPDDWHDIGALVLSLFMRRRGWEVIFLGQNVGLEGLRETLQDLQPRAVTLSVSRLPEVQYISEVAQILIDATAGHSIFTFAGRIFADLQELAPRLPGYYLGSDLISAADFLENLLMNDMLPPVKRPVTQTALQYDLYNQRLQLEALAQSHLLHREAARECVEVLLLLACYNDSVFVAEVSTWARQTLPSYHVSPQQILDFVNALRDFADAELPRAAGVVVSQFSAAVHPDTWDVVAS